MIVPTIFFFIMFIDLKVFIYKYSLCLLLIEESSVNISQSFIGNSLYWLGSFILRLPLIQKTRFDLPSSTRCFKGCFRINNLENK